MAYSNLTLILELPPQSSTLWVAAFGALGIILGAVFTGLLGYVKDRKSKLLQAYSQLIGKKFVLIQLYTNLYGTTCFDHYNQALQKEADKLAGSTNKEIKRITKSLTEIKKNNKLKNQEAIKEMENLLKTLKMDLENYRNQEKEIQKDNQSNIERYSKEQHELIENTESFWKIIGIIDGLLNDKEVKRLIENVRIAHKSIENFQEDLINETLDGLPNVKINDNDLVVSSWKEDKKPEIKRKVDDFEKVIDTLIDYLRDNGINRPLWKFIF